MDSIDASLKRLNMDYVDVFMLHYFDVNTPVEEIMSAMNDIVCSGKARYIGVSTMLNGQLEKILMACERNGWVKPIYLQLRISKREDACLRTLMIHCVRSALGPVKSKDEIDSARGLFV